MKKELNRTTLVEIGNELKYQIKTKKDIFSETIVFVPDKSVEQWFKAFWLNTEDDVLMNVKFKTLNEGIFDIFDIAKYQNIVSPLSLNYFVLKALVSLTKEELGETITNYIYKENSIDSTKLYDLSTELTNLFTNYEKDMIEITGNQEIIYDYVMNELDNNSLFTIKHLIDQNTKYKYYDNTINIFGYDEFDHLTQKIIDDFSKDNNVIIYSLKKNENVKLPDIKLVSAPSKEKEIVSLHSTICELLKDKTNTYKDFLVLAPNITDYEIEIVRVFKQDNISFPNIPFIINNKNKKSSELTKGLNVLFNILKKGFFTRFDFIDLITNKMIMESRNIEEDNINSFKQIIAEANVYRNDDWNYAKKRIVLSKLVDSNQIDDNIIQVKNQKYLTYSNISLDDESKVKFIKLVDDLYDWTKLFSNNPLITDEIIDSLMLNLSKWFSILDQNNCETNIIFKKIISGLNNWKKYNISCDNIPLFTLMYILIKSSEKQDINSSNLFIEGISFMDYLPNVILESKYVFFIGASSNCFPNKVIKSELDLRQDFQKDDYTHFELQVYNSRCLFNISFVNKNLKTDEDFYPSSFVLKLLNHKGIKKYEDFQINVQLDEKREWNHLYTKKEFKDKDFYYGLFNNKEEEYVPITVTKEVNHKVKVSDIVSFLKEPLQFKAEQLFKRYDNLSEKLENEYEALCLNALTKYILVSKVANYLLTDRKKELTDDEKNKLFLLYDLKHELPQINDGLKINAIDNVIKESQEIYDQIMTDTSGNYELKVLDDLNINVDNEVITITSKDTICINKNDDSRNYYELKKIKKETKEYLKLYISSLIDIAQEKTNVKYKVQLIKEGIKSFEITPNQAQEIIKKLLILMNDYSNNKYFDIETMDKCDYKELIDNALDPSGNKGAWKYFKDKRLFNENNLGYNEDDFDKEFNEMKNIISNLILFLKKGDE